MPHTFSVLTLGCFRNVYDSEVVMRRMVEEGFSFRAGAQRCHTLLINTCGFIDKAKEESLGVIREALILKKKGKVKRLVVFGCLAQRYRKELHAAFPEVDEWWGIEEFSHSAPARLALNPPYRDFLKVCEGCFHTCTYCAIPLIKGKLVSRPLGEVVKEAKILSRRGVKELNIIGQDVTSWGKDLGKKYTLDVLIREILFATDIPWIRIMYTHPFHFSDKLIRLIAREKRVCNYIDLPIQHINDRILSAMGRKVTRKQIETLIAKIRYCVPEAVIRTSLIVGFPTETEEEFRELLAFVENVRFERLGAFAYSREEGTPAEKMPQVHPQRKARRAKELMSLQKGIAASVNERFIGKVLPVLVEEKNGGILIGRSQYDAYDVDGVVFVHSQKARIGSFYKAKINGAHEYDLVAE
jgi:ribosomal protein S12 methylthiotransferase